MHNFSISRTDLEQLQKLLECKLTQLQELQQKNKNTDSDVNLTEGILKFVQFLVNKEISLASNYYTPTTVTPYYRVVPQTATPIYNNTSTTSSSDSSVGKPMTICSNCWAKNPSHTHCTHMLSSAIDGDFTVASSNDATFMSKFTNRK